MIGPSKNENGCAAGVRLAQALEGSLALPALEDAPLERGVIGLSATGRKAGDVSDMRSISRFGEVLAILAVRAVHVDFSRGWL